MNSEQLAQLLALWAKEQKIVEQQGKLYIWHKVSEGNYEKKFFAEVKQ